MESSMEPGPDNQVAAPGTSTMPQEKTFACFGDLPSELRDMIWDRALGHKSVVFIGYFTGPNEPRQEVDRYGFDAGQVALSCRDAAARWKALYSSRVLRSSRMRLPRFNPELTVFLAPDAAEIQVFLESERPAGCRLHLAFGGSKAYPERDLFAKARLTYTFNPDSPTGSPHAKEVKRRVTAVRDLSVKSLIMIVPQKICDYEAIADVAINSTWPTRHNSAQTAEALGWDPTTGQPKQGVDSPGSVVPLCGLLRRLQDLRREKQKAASAGSKRKRDDDLD